MKTKSINKPDAVTALRILNEAREFYARATSGGLCPNMTDAIYSITGDQVQQSEISKYVPEFTFTNAQEFGATEGNYWWHPSDALSRIRFMSHLINMYKKRIKEETK